jgi:hypothetical protein
LYISNVEPDLSSLLYYFDQQHQFFTQVDVYFLHQQKKLKAVLLFPYHKKGTFLLQKLEVFHGQQWLEKKGSVEQYGLALTNNQTVIFLGNSIQNRTLEAKEQLQERYQQIVIGLANRLEEEMLSSCPLKCEITSDYLTIVTSIEWKGNMIEGRVETNFSFSHTMDDAGFLQALTSSYKHQIMNSLQDLDRTQFNTKAEQKTYITTIPIAKQILDKNSGLGSVQHISVSCEGNCFSCRQTAHQLIKSNVRIDLKQREKAKLDIHITVLGDTFVCEHCNNIVKKEKIMIKDLNSGRIIEEKLLDDLIRITDEDEDLKDIIHAAINHEGFFHECQEEFWGAFTYIASIKWDSFIAELTRIELEYALRHYIPDLPAHAKKNDLLAILRKLKLPNNEKKHFWRMANEKLIQYYVFISVFGWQMEKEIAVIGINRAEFIFQYLPVPKELNFFRQMHAAFFSKHAATALQNGHKNMELQKQQIRHLQHKNGKLAEKLGQAHSRIAELEDSLLSSKNENRMVHERVKMEQLKGLITELKAEIARLSPVPEDKEPNFSEVKLEEKSGEEQEFAIDYLQNLTGKKIFVIGGFRIKPLRGEYPFTVFTHDARNLDPHFFEQLHNADFIIILTRYISHLAMWEAKEHAILTGKPIFYTTFTNIVAILNEAAREYSQRSEATNSS